jgi:farnesyl-diphosphate farnesyltransferase
MIAAFLLLRVLPLWSKSISTNKCIQDCYRITLAEDLKFCPSMLAKVSRSFAIAIQQLPQTLQVDIMVFYLVLRALDTIENDTALDRKVRTAALRNYAQNALLSESGWSMDGVGDGYERELLPEFRRIRRIYDRLPDRSKGVILDITQRMATGKASFADRDFRQGMASLEDYNLYCHYVSGLVMEGLSRIFATSGLETDPAFVSNSLSNQMGVSLQKTNMIRDYLEDYVDGRTFWPQSIWKRYSENSDLGYFVQQDDPVVREQSLRCLNELVTDALESVPDCLTYINTIQCSEIFRFYAIPQLLSLATLEK